MDNKTISPEKSGELAPSSDILEMEDGFHIIMDMPGVPKENLSVDLEENQLTIKGTSAYSPAKGEKSSSVHIEFSAQSFKRNFTLSDLVDRDSVKATMKDGVLRLFLPKAKAMQPRRIQIN